MRLAAVLDQRREDVLTVAQRLQALRVAAGLTRCVPPLAATIRACAITVVRFRRTAVVADGGRAQAFCIVDASSLIVMTDHGHGRRPRADMIRAFRVGE